MAEDPYDDPFHPPEIPTEVSCLHCGQEYDSYLIEWRQQKCADGTLSGFWCCPTPGCDGAGFGFDILPTDPEYQDEHGGWIYCGDEDEDDDDDALDFEDQYLDDWETPPAPDPSDTPPAPPLDGDDSIPW